MDLSHLLTPRAGEDGPSGGNLEYDPAYTAMELAAMPGEERQVGKSIIAAEEPDHAEVVAQALDVLGRSHDIRAAVYLAASDLRLNGLPGLAGATAYIRGCLEQYWDSCHPELDADDDNDPTMRINAVFSLADGDTVLRALRMAPLTDSRTFGRLALREILVATGEAAKPADMDTVPDAAAVPAAFQDTDPDLLAERLAAARAALADIRAIDAVFVARTPGQGPDLDALSRTLGQIVRLLADATGDDGTADAETAEDGDGPGEEAVPDAAPGGAPGAPGGAGAGPTVPGTIAGPGDVLAALDRIMAYYQRVEPSSPVPILLARARRLVGANFLDILKDIAPSGVENVNLIGGIGEDD